MRIMLSLADKNDNKLLPSKIKVWIWHKPIKRGKEKKIDLGNIFRP